LDSSTIPGTGKQCASTPEMFLGTAK